MPPQLPPAPQDSIIEGEPRDENPLNLEGEDVIERANQQVNQVPVQQGTPETFAQETAQQSTTNFIDAVAGLSAPEVYDAAARAQQLQQEQGISSLSEQLNIVDAEITSYDARVRETARVSRDRLVPQSLINRELQQIQVASAERRNLLLAERNFLQNQVTSRNNIINSLIQFEQMSYQNAVNAYNAGVDRYLQIYQLQQNQRLAELDIRQKEVEFARAQADYTMDIILNAAKNGVSLDSIPQSLLSNLSELSLIATGDPDYYANLANFIVANNIASVDDRTDFRPLAVTRDAEGNYYQILYDQATAQTITKPIPGTIVATGSGSRQDDLINPVPGGGTFVNTDRGTQDYVVTNRDGTSAVFPTQRPNDAPNPKSPEREELRDLGVRIIPSWLSVGDVNAAILAIHQDKRYVELAGSILESEQEEAKIRAQNLFEAWFINTKYRDAITEAVPILYQFPQEAIPFTGGDRYNPGLADLIQSAEQQQYRNFMNRLILGNAERYKSGGDLLKDIQDRPDYFRKEYAKFIETGYISDQSSTPLNTNNQGTTNTQTVTNTQQAQVPQSISQYRDTVAKYFPEGDVENFLYIINDESRGRVNVINNTTGRTDLPEGQLPEFSVGLLQINLEANADIVERLSGIPASNRQAQIAWLQVPENNIAAGAEVFKKEGYGGWRRVSTNRGFL